MNIRYERDASPNHSIKFAGFPDHVSIDYVEVKGKNMKIWDIVIETSKRDCEQSLKKRC